MSLPELTQAAARAIQAACLLASQENLPEASPRHVLSGLLAEEEGRAAELLALAGVPASALATFRCPAMPAPVDDPPGMLPPPGEAVHSILVRARALSIDLVGERTVASEYILLASLEADCALLHDLLGKGLDRSRLDQAIRREDTSALVLEQPLEIPERLDLLEAARILDASANRAREGLRVLEDYCRFVLDDAFLTQEVKEIRHALAGALSDIPAHILTHARDTEKDVGTDLTTPTELERSSLCQVVRASSKRVQEALRSLEEYAKMAWPRASASCEKLRYRAYTLEKAILVHDRARLRFDKARLYVLLTRGLARAGLDWTIAEAAAGGANVFQLREKSIPDRELIDLADSVRRWTQRAQTLFIMNDRPDIARLVGADGVHLGQDDMSVTEARRILGPDGLIGVSTHAPADIDRAIRDGADYLGVGPVFPSGTKSFQQLAGLELVRHAAATTSLPWFAIGGIEAGNVAQVLRAGGSRIAVSRAVIAADEPQLAAANLIAAWSNKDPAC